MRLAYQLEDVSEAVDHAGRNDLDLLVLATGHVHFDDQRVARDERRLGHKVVTRRGAPVGSVAEAGDARQGDKGNKREKERI